jgi:hypothetical protein
MPSVEQLNLFHSRFFLSSNGAAVNGVTPEKSGTYWVLAVNRNAPVLANVPIVPMRMYCVDRNGRKTWHEIDKDGNIIASNTERAVIMWIEPNNDKAERRASSHGGNHVA